MTFEEIFQILESTGFPVAYYAFESGNVPELPFVVYYYPGNHDDPADNTNYGRINRLNVELYTKEKSFETEAQIESVLPEIGVYSKAETYLPSESMYEILYEMEVAINGEN